MSDSETKRALEAILFVADEPVGTSDLAVLLEMSAEAVESHLAEMGAAWEAAGRGIVLRQVAEGWRIATHPAAAPYLERFVSDHRSPRLTQAALETLAIVAYRQPMSRGQIAEIRGTSSEGVIKTLIARGLVEEIGRDEGPGQAILYGVTTTFLERLGLNAVTDLPPLPQFMPDTEAVERMESGLGPGV